MDKLVYDPGRKMKALFDLLFHCSQMFSAYGKIHAEGEFREGGHVRSPLSNPALSRQIDIEI